MAPEPAESSPRPRIGVRELTPPDADFLVDMVLEAVNWNGERHSRRGVLGSSRLARYAVGWGREGDLGLIAVDLEGPRGLQVPVGAAWVRRYPRKEAGYGYVAEDVPEASLAIVPGYRRLGIGRALLLALLDRLREQGTAQVSLSVARENPAIILYQEVGFVPAPEAPGTDEETVTMVLALTPAPESVQAGGAAGAAERK